jgi:hypothetical protein
MVVVVVPYVSLIISSVYLPVDNGPEQSFIC